MNRLFVITAAALATVAVAAPAQSDAPRRFAVASFDAVDLSGSDAVRVVTGNAISVVATGDPRAVAALAIDVRGDVLRIGRRPGNWHDRGALVTVTMPSLHAASLSGSGTIRADGVAGNRFEARLSGSGGLVLSGLRVRDARFDLGGSGTVRVDGRADRVAIDLGGSGSIDARYLAAADAMIGLGGSGDVSASATRLATVRADGSGQVRVTGGARCDVHRGGSATVSCG